MYAIVSDVHLHNWSQFSVINDDGENSRLRLILNALDHVVEHSLKEGITRGYCAGDLFHVRGRVAPSVLNPTLETFKRHQNRGFGWRMIPGNHDLEGKNSDELGSAISALRGVGVEVYNDQAWFIDDHVVMIPWRESLDELRAELLDLSDSTTIDTSKTTVIIHAPVNGVIKGIPDTGLEVSELEAYGFKHIFAGHYHNSIGFGDGKVWSIGALTHQTFSDVDSRAGYLHVYDDGSVAHFEVPDAPKFISADWDDINEGHVSGNDRDFFRVNAIVESNAEAVEIKECLQKNGFKHFKLNATINKPTAVRGSVATKTGVSIEESIATFIDESAIPNSKEVFSLCEEILREAREHED